MPAPKIRAQIRLAQTRGVNGFSRLTSHRATSKRVGVPETGDRQNPHEDRGLHGIAGIQEVAPLVNPRHSRLVRVQLAHDRQPDEFDVEGLQRLLVGGDLIPQLPALGRADRRHQARGIRVAQDQSEVCEGQGIAILLGDRHP